MGQKINPTGFRIGIVEPWRSRWYASKKEFGDLLIEDFKIRNFVKTKYQFAGIPKIEIERTRDQVVIHLFTARPGIIIGRKGQEVDRLKAELEDLTGRRMELKIVEINNPHRSAVLVAEDVAQQLMKRGSFRRTIKRTLDQVMDAGAFGVKDRVVRAAGWRGNVPARKSDSRFDPPFHAATAHRLRLLRLEDGRRLDRRESVDRSGRLFD